MKGWEEVATVAEFEDTDRKLVDLGGTRQIGLFKVNGEFFAISAYCTHMQVSMMHGPVEEGELVCPMHGARFDLRRAKKSQTPDAIVRRTRRAPIPSTVSANSGVLQSHLREQYATHATTRSGVVMNGILDVSAFKLNEHRVENRFSTPICNAHGRLPLAASRLARQPDIHVRCAFPGSAEPSAQQVAVLQFQKRGRVTVPGRPLQEDVFLQDDGPLRRRHGRLSRRKGEQDDD